MALRARRESARTACERPRRRSEASTKSATSPTERRSSGWPRRFAIVTPRSGLLVNNAGLAGRGNYLDLEPERVEELIRINYLGSVWCLLAFLPALEAAAPSHLVNVVSVAGTVAIGPYSASKHAQLAFSRSVARELRPRGIHVHTINPGFVHTEGFPQDWLLRRRYGRVVVGPEYVADRIVRAIERDRAEIFVPRWYRAAAIAQALLPGAFRRVPARRANR